jgi:molybdopterin-guanine dinucleotide biosynthesis protein A
VDLGSPLGGDGRAMQPDVRAQISGFVLAGGRSSRLGQDKALLPWHREGNSRTLLDHAIARLQRVCNTVSICADRTDLGRTEAVIPDTLPGSGPLGGIVAALEQSTTEWNIFLAVDLPLLPVEVLKALIACVKPAEPIPVSAGEHIVCVIPQLEGLPQPLCGLYRRILAPGLRRALETGNLKIMAALRETVRSPAPRSELQPENPALRIELWDVAGFAATMKPSPSLDPSEWFLNVNTPEEWQRAQQRRFE